MQDKKKHRNPAISKYPIPENIDSLPEDERNKILMDLLKKRVDDLEESKIIFSTDKPAKDGEN